MQSLVVILRIVSFYTKHTKGAEAISNLKESKRDGHCLSN